jgi:transposase
MLNLPPSVRILLAREPADMRKGFDGLSNLVQGVLKEDPLSGHLFVFRNRRGDRIKLLLWDTDGFLILYKRLEKGAFRFPVGSEAEATSVTVTATDLIMLLDGVDLQSIKRRPRYVRESARFVRFSRSSPFSKSRACI